MAIQDKQTLDDLIETLFADNNSRDITAEALRGYLQEHLDSTQLQRQLSQVRTETAFTFALTDIDQNKFQILQPAPAQSQSMTLPLITTELIGRTLLMFANYSDQQGTFIAAGANVILGANPIPAEQALITLRALDIDTWTLAAVPLDPPYLLTSIAAAVLVFIGYGGVSQNVPVALPDITGAFQILPANVGALTTPILVNQDFANDGIRFNAEGVWSINIVVALEHVSINSGRTFDVEIFNVTTASSFGSTPVAVGRDQEGTNYAATLLVEVANADVGDLFVIRVGNASTNFTVVQLDGYTLSAHHISEALTL